VPPTGGRLRKGAQTFSEERRPELRGWVSPRRRLLSHPLLLAVGETSASGAGPVAECRDSDGTSEAPDALFRNDDVADGGDKAEDLGNDEVLAFVAPPNGKGRAGMALDIEKLTIKWKPGERGSQMQKGGFGYVYFGSYDASDFAGAAYSEVKVVVTTTPPVLVEQPPLYNCNCTCVVRASWPLGARGGL